MSLVAAAAASVEILPTSNPQGVGQWSRVAGRLPLLPPPPPPSPTRAHSAGRPELETAGWGGGGGDSGLRERGPPGQTDGVAHPLGAGRRPFGGNPKGVSEPRRLVAARHASFTGSKVADGPKQKGLGVNENRMTSILVS